MADGRKGSSNSSRYFSRRRGKKTPEVVELSDSSSGSSEDVSCLPPAKTATAKANLKSTPLPETSLECPVCLQPCIHPARLPCGHIFCFLCLKGIAQQSRRCAMCRQEISPDYLDRPDLLQVPETHSEKEAETFEDGYQWFYEGRNANTNKLKSKRTPAPISSDLSCFAAGIINNLEGWWQFEERLSKDLEETRRLGQDSLETLICGTLYVIDLKALVQYNKNCPSRKRKIKRDLVSSVVVKGVAGIR